MTKSADRQPISTQQQKPNVLRTFGFIDIHCHCLPGFDDGPMTMTEATELSKALVADGITTVIATPHQLGRFDGCYSASQIRQAVAALNQELKERRIPLTVVPGADIRVDERILQLLQSDCVLTLADGGKYVLLELPYDEVFIDIEPLLKELAAAKVRAIITHPERHNALDRHTGTILKWLSHSAYFQITASSLLGDESAEVERAAWHFLNSGWAAFVATDSHNINARRPRMKAAFERISANFNEHIARQLCIENPSRVVNGQDVLPVPVHNLVETNR